MSKYHKRQSAKASVLTLFLTLAAVGLLAYLLIISLAPFRRNLSAKLFPQHASLADTVTHPTTGVIALQQASSSSILASPSLTFPVSVTQGDMLIAQVISAPNSLSMPGDTQSNSWNLAVSQNTQDEEINLYYTFAKSSGSDTVNLKTTTRSAYIIAEYTGIDQTNPLDRTGVSQGLDAFPTVKTPDLPSQSNELVLAAEGNMLQASDSAVPNTSSNPVGTDPLNLDNSFSQNGNLDLVQQLIDTASQSATISWNAQDISPWASTIATFRAATPSYNFQKDINYCSASDGTPLAADLYTPVSSSSAKPLLIEIHGGEWVSGDKEQLPFHVEYGIEKLTEAGYAVAPINYSLCPTYRFPEPIENAKCAIRYFRANASQYGIDPNKISAWGTSAGGQIVGLLGTTNASQGWDTGQYLNVSSQVQSVISDYGADDLNTLPSTTEITDGLSCAFGQNPSSQTLSTYSPTTYTSSSPSAFLIQHGLDDTHIPYTQSQELYNDLKSASASSTLQLIQNAQHSFDIAWPGAVLNPSYAGLTDQMLQFENQLFSTPQSSSSPSSCPSKTGDFNNDGSVNLTDLSIFASSYGTTSPNIPNPCTDLNQDGSVNLTDLSLFAAVYGS